MASRIAPIQHTPVTLPPKGWRKPMPLRVKLQVIINQKGLAPDGMELDAINTGIEFDHRPPLHDREYVAENDDTIPAANDPRFIVALPERDHHAVTGKDNTRMKKEARIRTAESEFRETLRRKSPGEKRKPKGTIRSKPFPKAKRRLRA